MVPDVLPRAARTHSRVILLSILAAIFPPGCTLRISAQDLPSVNSGPSGEGSPAVDTWWGTQSERHRLEFAFPGVPEYTSFRIQGMLTEQFVYRSGMNTYAIGIAEHLVEPQSREACEEVLSAFAAGFPPNTKIISENKLELHNAPAIEVQFVRTGQSPPIHGVSRAIVKHGRTYTILRFGVEPAEEWHDLDDFFLAMRVMDSNDDPEAGSVSTVNQEWLTVAADYGQLKFKLPAIPDYTDYEVNHGIGHRYLLSARGHVYLAYCQPADRQMTLEKQLASIKKEMGGELVWNRHGTYQDFPAIRYVHRQVQGESETYHAGILIRRGDQIYGLAVAGPDVSSEWRSSDQFLSSIRISELSDN